MAFQSCCPSPLHQDRKSSCVLALCWNLFCSNYWSLHNCLGTWLQSFLESTSSGKFHFAAEGKAALALLTQSQLSCEKHKGSSIIPGLFLLEKTELEEQPRARLTSVLPRGDQVWFPVAAVSQGMGKDRKHFPRDVHFPLQN